ncbi:MAG: hypothetical protein COT16_00335 [Elusimicrobia bacterium CG08_land_8_20_14_0_20_44_26]|nr:MAG: hypothetical protein COT16_00335 [Elusimicrobia bacterium CG08_land_8_20_14_0_20_44_26]
MQKEKLKINTFGEIGSTMCISTEDGEKIFSIIKKAFDKNITVEISFLNIEMITSAFLNAAIGQLYGKYEEKFIQQHLSVKDMADEDKFLLKRVVVRAKDYFANKKNMEKVIAEGLNENA